jgi:hypothetical protein
VERVNPLRIANDLTPIMVLEGTYEGRLFQVMIVRTKPRAAKLASK